MFRGKLSREFFWILLAGLILRLILIPFGNHDDLLVNAIWGRWIYAHGTHGFYETGDFILLTPTQAPLFNLFLGWTYHGYIFVLHFFDFIKFHIGLIPANLIWWWERTYFGATDIFWGYLMW